MVKEIVEQSSSAMQIEHLKKLSEEVKKKNEDFQSKSFSSREELMEEHQKVNDLYFELISRCNSLIESGHREAEIYMIKAKASQSLYNSRSGKGITFRDVIERYLTAILATMSGTSKGLWMELGEFVRKKTIPPWEHRGDEPSEEAHDLAELMMTPLADLEVGDLEFIVPLGILMRRDDKLEKSFEMLQKAKIMAPDNLKIRHEIALTYEAFGDFDHAREILKKSIKMDPDHYLPYRQYAEYWERRGEDSMGFNKKPEYFEKAIKYMKIAVMKCHDDKDWQLLQTLEWYCCRMWRYDEAKEANIKWREKLEIDGTGRTTPTGRTLRSRPPFHEVHVVPGEVPIFSSGTSSSAAQSEQDINIRG